MLGVFFGLFLLFICVVNGAIVDKTQPPKSNINDKTAFMFTGISWYAYFQMVVTLTGTYYLLVLLRFRGMTWLSSWTKSRGTNLQPVETIPAGAPEKGHSHQEEETARACADELVAFFTAAKSSSWTREELLTSLQSILAKYAGIHHSEYLPMIVRVIISYSDYSCSIRLRKEDLVGLWKEG